jgi:fumarylacetoacetate (FAA) hydrolase
MKLATLRNGTRDGQLMVVSRDLTRGLPVPQIAATLQRALDDWARLSPRLLDAADGLESGRAPGSIPFDPATVLRAAAALASLGGRLGLREPRRSWSARHAGP